MGSLHCTMHVGMFLFGVLSLTVTLLCIVEYITILSDITMATQTFACQSLNVEWAEVKGCHGNILYID